MGTGARDSEEMKLGDDVEQGMTRGWICDEETMGRRHGCEGKFGCERGKDEDGFVRDVILAGSRISG